MTARPAIIRIIHIAGWLLFVSGGALLFIGVNSHSDPVYDKLGHWGFVCVMVATVSLLMAAALQRRCR